MRIVSSFLGIIIVTAIAAGTSTPAPADDQQTKDYSLGEIVGQCVVMGCEIFSGTVSASSAERGRPVPIFFNRWVLGHSLSPGEETINVPYGTSRDPFARVWADARVVQNAGVTVILALRDGLFGAGEAALVTSSPRDQGIIQSLADEGARLEAEPGRMADLVAGLSQGQDPALAGYIFANLQFRGLVAEPERAEDLLGQMIFSPSMPQEREELAVVCMVLDYFRLSDRGKEGVVKGLAQLSLLKTAQRAKAGYMGLAKIFSFDDEAPARIPLDVVEGLIKNYRKLVKGGSLRRDPVLERGLKIDF
jgi:hypothetical protein